MEGRVLLTLHNGFVEMLPIASETSDSTYHLVALSDDLYVILCLFIQIFSNTYYFKKHIGLVVIFRT